MVTLVHAIMCGGAGTRLWPWSRRSFPKQFQTLAGDISLLQTTLGRLAGLEADVRSMAIGSAEHGHLIAGQLGGMDTETIEIVLEPAARNTACVAMIAALRAFDTYGGDSVILLSAADHYIADPIAYRRAIESAIPVARSGRIVTFGIRPDRPETGYGYIEVGEALAGLAGAHAITSFREKPDFATASAYVDAGTFLWNAGIFMFTAGDLLRIAEELQPTLLALSRRACAEASAENSVLLLAMDPFLAMENISFDYAIMERIGDRGAVIPTSMGWSDVGSWTAIRDLFGTDAAGNVTRGHVETFDCTGVLGFTDGPLLVTHGLKDTIIIASRDAVYVATPEAAPEVKAVVSALEARGRPEVAHHRRRDTRWGWSETASMDQGLQVSQFMLRAGEILSLEPRDRDSQVLVLQGAARLRLDGGLQCLNQSQSARIPSGTRLELENHEMGDLRLVCMELA
jgi:mannose-1-phosphate guanylyltransferase/mannose-6-phosphate isomerase